MAFKWVSKIRGLLPGQQHDGVDDTELAPGDDLLAGTTQVSVQPGKAEPKPEARPQAEPPPWMTMVVNQTPSIMFVIGILLTVCAQLIQVWAFLGFLLVAGAPIVYWLRRIETRVCELIEVTKKKDAQRK